MGNLATIKRLQPAERVRMEEAAAAVVAAREEAERVAAMLAEIEGNFKAIARVTGETSVTLGDGTKVTAILDAERRNANLETLRELTSEEIFAKATKPAVDWAGFDALTRLGMVTPETVAKVVTTTTYSAVRVSR